MYRSHVKWHCKCVCVLVGFFVVRYPNSTESIFRNTLTQRGSAPYIKCHFTSNLYKKYPLTLPNLLLSSEKLHQVCGKTRLTVTLDRSRRIHHPQTCRQKSVLYFFGLLTTFTISLTIVRALCIKKKINIRHCAYFIHTYMVAIKTQPCCSGTM